MKLPGTRTSLVMPLLSIAVALSASSFAAAPDGPTQRDRAAATALPAVPERAPANAQEARDRVNQEAQGRVDSQQPRAPTNTPGQHACENSHAPAGTPDLADNDNAQGGNPRANENAQGSRAEENQSTQGAENSRAQIAQAGDDCLDVDSTLRENARGQGTGTTPDSRGDDQIRNPKE